MPWLIKPCEFCEKEFRSQTWVGHERRFCSSSCKQKFSIQNETEKFPWIKKGKRISQCRECGKDYWQRHADKYFCNTECYLKWKRKQTPRLICCVCSKEYLNNKNIKQEKIFTCSQECNKAYYYSIREKNMTRKFQAAKSIELFGIACERCGSEENTCCHHLDCNPKNNPLDGSNWMRLCESCHKITHFVSKQNGKMLTREEIKKLEYDKRKEQYKRVRSKCSPS